MLVLVMFRIPTKNSGNRDNHTFLNSFSVTCLCAVLISLTGCRTAPPIQPVNLQEPGWTLHEGQAVWTLPKHDTTIAGGLLIATHPSGDVFAQFSKGPMTMALAQRSLTAWRLEIPARSKIYSTHGKPPRRIIWFQLANALTDSSLDKGWVWTIDSQEKWALENTRSGELLEGVFLR